MCIRDRPRPARHSGVENSSRVVRIRLAVPSGHPSRRFLFRRLFPSVPLDLSLFLRHLHRPLGQERQVPGLHLSSAVYIPELDGPPRPDFISYSPAADLRRVHFNFLDHFPLAGLAPRLAARLQLYRYLLLRRTQLWILPPYSAINFTYSPGR